MGAEALTLESLAASVAQIKKQFPGPCPERAYLDAESRRIMLEHVAPASGERVPSVFFGLKVFAVEEYGWVTIAMEVYQGTAVCFLHGQQLPRESAWQMLREMKESLSVSGVSMNTEGGV